jgi:glycogen debranching enzyme
VTRASKKTTTNSRKTASNAAASKRRRARLLPEAEPMAIQDIRDALVIRERDTFLLTNMAGQAPPDNANGYGLYTADTRYLSTLELFFAPNRRPMVLLSTAELGYSSEHVLTNFAMKDSDGRDLPPGTVEIRRTRVLQDVLEETLELTNYNAFEVDLELILRLGADFADIFMVRGFECEARPDVKKPRWQQGVLRMGAKGMDGRNRETVVFFDPRPGAVRIEDGIATVSFPVSLDRLERGVIRISVTLDGRLEAPQGVARFAAVERDYRKWITKSTGVSTDNDFFDAVLSRSLQDLRMLWNHHKFEGGYPAAGTPWYDTLFGRDTAVTGLQTVWLKPDMSKQCLGALARWQGKKFDAWRDEEPGRILHELRVGELTRTGMLPFSPYYGSVDSTPLFLLLAADYFRWTGDIELMQSLETNLRAALHWIEEYGDLNNDGFVEYEKQSPAGMVNQGWKDSFDSMVHGDGTLLDPPIALVEVQAYTYAAECGLAIVFDALGDAELAADLRARANSLRDRFRREFWDEGCFALALDGDGHPSRAVTSNAGHALWAGIASRDQAGKQTTRLFKKDMFSGWGIRTLSEDSPRYNPQGYHVGTVWPHDNSMIAMGLKRYGFEGHLNRLATAIFEAAKSFPYYRLPELFGGEARTAHNSPVPYPVACRPQAWAAGAVPLITQAILGLCPDAPNRRLYIVRPRLPDWLRTVSLSKLRVGPAEADLRYERRDGETHVQVLETRGDVSVSVVDQWPDV